MDTLRLQVILDGIDRATKPLQGILKGTSALGKAAKETRDRLRDLNSQQKQLEGFRNATARVTETAQALQAARDRVRDLGQQITAATNPSKNLTDEYRAATAELRKLSNAHDKATAAQRLANADMQRAGVPVAELASRQRTLAQQIAATTAALERQGSQLNRVKALQASYQRTISARDTLAGAGASTLAVGTGAGLPILKSIKDFAALQTATSDLKIAMMEAGKVVPEEFGKIAAKAKELGSRLPGSGQDFMLAGKALVEQGVNFKTIVEGGLEATSYLAVLLKLEKDRAAEFIAKAREVHGLQDRDLPAGADLMQRARFGFGLKADQIYEAMSYAGTDMNIKGLIGNLRTMKEYLALQGMAAGVGLEGSSFGTNFAHMLKAMANVNKLDDARGAEGKYVGKLLASNNVKLDFFDAAGQFAGFGKMVQELEKLKQFRPQDQERILKKLFDTEGGRPAAIFLKNGMQGFQEALDKMDKQASLNERVNESLRTLQNRWDALGGASNEFSTKVGGILSPAVEGLIQRLNDLVEGANKFIDDNPNLSRVLVGSAALFAGVTLGVGALLLAVSAVLGPFALFRFAVAAVGLPAFLTSLGTLAGTALPAVATALRVLAALAMAHPIIAFITLVAGAAALIWANWDTLGPKFMALWDKIKGIFSSGVQYILDKIAALKAFFGFNVTATPLATTPVASQPPLRAGGGTVTQTTTNTITVNGAPGQSPADVAKAVRTELDARDRQRQAQRRSVLADAN